LSQNVVFAASIYEGVNFHQTFSQFLVDSKKPFIGRKEFVMNIFLRFPKVMDAMAMSRSTVHLRIKQGLLTPPVKISDRCSVWPEYEISAIIAARIAQKSNDEIRELVTQLHKKRATMA
jgi:prophage regulatory protein